MPRKVVAATALGQNKRIRGKLCYSCAKCGISIPSLVELGVHRKECCDIDIVNDDGVGDWVEDVSDNENIPLLLAILSRCLQRRRRSANFFAALKMDLECQMQAHREC